jgi:hypothetical protein
MIRLLSDEKYENRIAKQTLENSDSNREGEFLMLSELGETNPISDIVAYPLTIYT